MTGQPTMANQRLKLDKEQIILQIKANPADPEVFELHYCPQCRNTVAAGGLFQGLAEQTEQAGHYLAWLPGQDSLLPPTPTEGHIRHWLALEQTRLDPARYTQLSGYAGTTNSGNWVWLLRGSEQTSWLAYLAAYLDRLADGWLAALNGEPSVFFPQPLQIWRLDGPVPTQRPVVDFTWEDQFEK